MQRVLFICSRNIFRSAFAEVVFAYIGSNSDTEISVSSAGVDIVRGGQPADALVCELASQRGYDLSKHKSTPIGEYIKDDFDYALWMDESQRQSVQLWAKTGTTKIAPLMNYVDNRKSNELLVPHSPNLDLSYRLILDSIEEACLGIWRFINENDKKK